jgi:hypothetical protein
MAFRKSKSPSRGPRGDTPTATLPARSDIGENSASELIESPRWSNARDPLDPHDFPDGGGSGGAQAFSRRRLKSSKRPR